MSSGVKKHENEKSAAQRRLIATLRMSDPDPVLRQRLDLLERDLDQRDSKHSLRRHKASA